MKLSQWHDGSVKPVHIGVYESDDEKGAGIPWYRLWDGKCWRNGSCKKMTAANRSLPSPCQNWPWRGIVK